jgi:hypothetical protein
MLAERKAFTEWDLSTSSSEAIASGGPLRPYNVRIERKLSTFGGGHSRPISMITKENPSMSGVLLDVSNSFEFVPAGERTQAEHRAIYPAAGCKLTGAIATASLTGISGIEGNPARIGQRFGYFFGALPVPFNCTKAVGSPTTVSAMVNVTATGVVLLGMKVTEMLHEAPFG